MALSRSPQSIREDVWYYEEKGGLTFVVAYTIANTSFAVGRDQKQIQFTVPWRKIKASVRRKKL